MSRRPVGQLRQVIELEYEPGNLVYEWADVDLTEFPHLIVDHGRWLAEGETLEFQRRELVQTFVSLLELPPERFWQQLIESWALMAKSTPRQMTHVQLLPLFQDMELATRTAAQVPAIRALATAELIAANASGTSDNAEIAVAVLAKQADLKSIPALVDSQLFGNVDRIPFSDSGASAAIRTVRDPAIIDLLATRFDEFDEFTQADIAIAIGATQCVEAEKALLGLIKGIQPDDIRYECIAKGLRWLSFASDETQEVLLTAALTQEGLEDEEDLAEQVATLSLILGWTDPRAAELRERVGTEEDRDRQLLEQWNPFGDFADALAPSERPQPILSPTPNAKSEPKAGRNDPCPCGSGKKYKKCCLK